MVRSPLSEKLVFRVRYIRPGRIRIKVRRVAGQDEIFLLPQGRKGERDLSRGEPPPELGEAASAAAAPSASATMLLLFEKPIPFHSLPLDPGSVLEIVVLAVLLAPQLEGGNLDTSIESLLNVEKQARLAGDVIATKDAVTSIIRLCFEAQAWKTLNDQIVLLSKRRGQLKQ
ncbi:hypothetical protein Taro_003816, partial [Colocasia esculenta]|nr:hypothetical protein [Colocasia esculenta]